MGRNAQRRKREKNEDKAFRKMVTLKWKLKVRRARKAAAQEA